MKNKAIFKYNSGNLALMCSFCNSIIKVGYEFTNEELEACKGNKKLERQYCQKCKEKYGK